MAHLFTTAPITGHSLYKSQWQAKCVFFYWRWYQSAFVMNKRSQLPLSTAAAGSSADHAAGTSAEYLWCVGSSCCSALGENYDKRGGKTCTHVVPMSKMNSRTGCYCKRFISGAPGTCLRVVFIFVSSASKSFAGEQDMSFVGEVSFHFEKAFAQTHLLLGKKWQGFRRWRSVFKSCHWKDLSSQSALFTPSTSIFLVSISLYTQYI